MTANPSLPNGKIQNLAGPTGPPRIYLVRHGQTAWSLSGQFTGRTDLPLTAHGENEARELGARIRNIAFSRVLTSPLQRARRTCELARLPTPPEIEPDLTEWDHGDDEGRFPADVLNARPGWDLFRDGSPHGETPAQIAARADRFLSRLRLMAGNVALFSHGHFGRALAARWIGLPVEQARHFLFETASLSVLCCQHDRAGEPAIALWNAAPPDLLGPQHAPPVCDSQTAKRRALERWETEGEDTPAAPAAPAGLWERLQPISISHRLGRAPTTDTQPLASQW